MEALMARTDWDGVPQDTCTTINRDSAEESLHSAAKHLQEEDDMSLLRSRARTESGRPSSLRGARSRTTTINSVVSFGTTAPPETSVSSISGLKALYDRNPSGQFHIDRPSSVAKSFLSRSGQKLRRQGSKLGLVSSITQDDASHEGKQSLDKSKNYKQSTKQPVNKETLKSTISKPFDFQHITHTQRAHFGSFQRVTRNELISDFSAIRAGQRSTKELQGIKTQDLPTAKELSARIDLSRSDSTSASRCSTPTPPVTPERTRNSSKSTITTLARSSCSIENFSRPSPRSPSLPLTRPRSTCSSRAGTSPPFSQTKSNAHVGNGPELASPLRSLDHPLVASTVPLPAIIGRGDPVCDRPTVGNAVSTHDESARQLRVSPLPPLPTAPSDLADVPEEEEGLFWAHADDHTRQTVGPSSLRHAQTFPSSKRYPDGSNHPALGRPQHVPQYFLDDTPEEPWASESPIRTCDSLSDDDGPSGALHTPDIDNWEIDVDYCYEHAAEADCDFAWDVDTGILGGKTSLVHPLSQDVELSRSIQSWYSSANFVDHRSQNIMSYPHTSKPLPPLPLGDYTAQFKPVPALPTSNYQEIATPGYFPHPASDDVYKQPTVTDLLVNESTANSALADPADHQAQGPGFDNGGDSPVRQSHCFRTRDLSVSNSNSDESIILSIGSSVMATHRSFKSNSSLDSLPEGVQETNRAKDISNIGVQLEKAFEDAEVRSADSFSFPRNPLHDKDNSTGVETIFRETDLRSLPDDVAGVSQLQT